MTADDRRRRDGKALGPRIPVPTIDAKPRPPMPWRNAARCLLCDTVVESRHRHDYQTCPCGNLSVDGGRDYLRRVLGQPDTCEEVQ